MGVLPSSLDVLDLRLDGKAVRNSGLVTSLDSVCSARIICTGFDSAPRGPTLGQNQDPPVAIHVGSRIVVEFSQLNPCWQSALNCSFVPLLLFLFSIFVSSFFSPSNLGDVHTRGEGAFLAYQIWVCWRQQTQISNARQLQPLQPLQPL